MVFFLKLNIWLKALYVVFGGIFFFSLLMMIVSGIFLHGNFMLSALVCLFISGMFSILIREYYSYRNERSIDEDIKL